MYRFIKTVRIEYSGTNVSHISAQEEWYEAAWTAQLSTAEWRLQSDASYARAETEKKTQGAHS